MPATLAPSSSSSLSSSSLSSNPASMQQQKCYGKIIVIKRNGQDSASFELSDANYVFGRAERCDIRIQLECIGEEHCRIFPEPGGRFAVLQNLSSVGVMVNDAPIKDHKEHPLKGGDVITIVERSFRYENPFWSADEDGVGDEVVAGGAGTPKKAPSTPLKTQSTPAPASAAHEGAQCPVAKTASPSRHGRSGMTTPIKKTGSPVVRDQMTITPTKHSLTPTPKITDQFREGGSFDVVECTAGPSLPRSPAKFAVQSTLKNQAAEESLTTTPLKTTSLTTTPLKTTPLTTAPLTTAPLSTTPLKTPTVAPLNAVTPISQTKDIGRIIPVSGGDRSVVAVTPQSETRKSPIVIGSAGYSALMNSSSQGKDKERAVEQSVSPLLQRGVIDHEISASPRLSPRIKLIAGDAAEEGPAADRQASPVSSKIATNDLLLAPIGDLLAEPPAQADVTMWEGVGEGVVVLEEVVQERVQEEEGENVETEQKEDQPMCTEAMVVDDQDIIQGETEDADLYPKDVESEGQQSSLVVTDQVIADQSVVVVDLALAEPSSPAVCTEETVQQVDVVMTSASVVEESGEIDDVQLGMTDTAQFEETDTAQLGMTDTAQFEETDTAQLGMTDTAQFGMADTAQFGTTDTAQFGIIENPQLGIIDTAQLGIIENPQSLEEQNITETKSQVTAEHEASMVTDPESAPSTPRRSARLQRPLTATPSSKLRITTSDQRHARSDQKHATIAKGETEEKDATTTQSARRRSTRAIGITMSSAQKSKSTGPKKSNARVAGEAEDGVADNSPSIQAFRRSGRAKSVAEEDKENEQQQQQQHQQSSATQTQPRRQGKAVKRPSEAALDHEDPTATTSEAEVTIRKSARTARAK